MKQRTNILLLSALAALGLVACGGGESQPTSSSVTEESSQKTESSQPDSSSKPEESSVEPTPSTSVEPEVKKYKIIDAESDHVFIVNAPKEAKAGEPIEFTIALEPGYEFHGQIEALAGQERINLVKSGEYTYQFTMPDRDVTIAAQADLSAYAIKTNVGDGLSVEAYWKAQMQDVSSAKLAKIAGTYGGDLYYTAYSKSYFAMEFDLFGNVSMSRSYSPTSTIEYKATGEYEVTKRTVAGEDMYIVDFEFNKMVPQSGTYWTDYANIAGQFVYFDDGTDRGFTLVNMHENAYSATYQRDYTEANNDSHKLIKSTEDAIFNPTEMVTVPVGMIPEFEDYQTEYYLEVTEDKYTDFTGMTIDGVPAQPGADGMFKIEVPAHSVTIDINAAEKHGAINIEAGNHITATAYVQDDTGAYVLATDATHDEQIYLKIDTGTGDEWFASNITAVLEDEGTALTLKNGDIELNEDGYYTGNDLVMVDPSFGIDITLVESPRKYSNDSLLGDLYFADNGTVTIGGQPIASYALEGEQFAMLQLHEEAGTADGLLLTALALDPVNLTYAKVPGQPFQALLKGAYYGASLTGLNTASPTATSYYKVGFGITSATSTTIDITKGFWESSTYPMTLQADGTIKISSYVAHISEDGETVVAMATASSSCYAMSRTITTYSNSAYKLKKAAYGATALCEICPSSSTYGTMNGDLFMLENGQIVFGYAENLTGDEIWLDGCEFDLTLGGVSRGNMVNVGGTSSTAGKITPNVLGTYTTGGDDLVVTGTGVTYGALTNKPYELDDQTMVITFFNDVLGEDDVTTRTIYAATVDPVTHTATIATSEKYYKDQPVDTVWNEGTYPWTESPAGTWTAPSGHHSTIVTIKVTCATAGVLSFDWTVSSESGYDYLNVQYDANGDGSTDGYAPGYSASTTDKNAHSGTGKSGKFTKDVVAGEVIWINYEKDSTTSKGLDNVVISNISLWGEVTL